MINNQDQQIMADQKLINFNLNVKCDVKSKYDYSLQKNCPPNAWCSSGGECKCIASHSASENRLNCEKIDFNLNYPGKGENCSSSRYCATSDLYCDFNSKTCECKSRADTLNCPLPTNGVFITASQIALSAALLMGVAALAMVIYRLCTKPKYLNARQRADAARATVNRLNNDSNNLNENVLGRSSVSSIQARILSRMQDRPPTYSGEIETPTVAPIHRNDNGLGSEIDSPPPYMIENERDMGIHQPPPYTEIVLNPSGYLNQSYVHTENDNRSNINGNNDDDREDLKKEKENESKTKSDISKDNSKT